MGEIVIHSSELNNYELISKVSVPRELKKYFKSLNFFSKYDDYISANKSILNIPLLSTVLPLAWLSGSDIYVDELDKVYLASMDELMQEFGKIYPKIPCTTRINCEIVVENEIGVENHCEHTALLFSGGVDSIYSLIKNLNIKPRLIMHWGVEGYPYPKHSEYWEKVISLYSEFSRKLGVPFNVVKTNAIEILNPRRIEHDFNELLYQGTFWARLQHSLVLVPLTAPLSIDRFNRLLIAATHHPSFPYKRHPWASQPLTDEKIRWANLNTQHDGFIPRPEKIMGLIKEYLKDDELTLRVCLKRRVSQEKLNCGSCEKCYRTIAPLVLAGIDPKDCGILVDDSTFQSMRQMLEKKKLDVESLEGFWKPIQEMVPNKIDNNMYNSKSFFEWFKNYDLKSAEENLWLYRDIYNKLPYQISKILDQLYKQFNIRIHKHSPVRKKKLKMLY